VSKYTRGASEIGAHRSPVKRSRCSPGARGGLPTDRAAVACPDFTTVQHRSGYEPAGEGPISDSPSVEIFTSREQYSHIHTTVITSQERRPFGSPGDPSKHPATSEQPDAYNSNESHYPQGIMLGRGILYVSPKEYQTLISFCWIYTREGIRTCILCWGARCNGLIARDAGQTVLSQRSTPFRRRTMPPPIDRD